MATSVRNSELTEEAVRALVAGAPEEQLVPVLFTADETKYQVFLVKCRAGGFLFVVPASEALQAFLEENHMLFAFHQCDIEVLPARSRSPVVHASFLVDVGWDNLAMFSRFAQLRGEAARALVRFMPAGSRPVSASVYAQADEWITGIMAEDTAAEYVTGDEEGPLDGVPVGDLELGFAANGAPDPDVVQQLQARVLELEGALRHQRAVPPGPPLAPPAGSGLLGAAPATVQPSVMDRLRSLAGPPPGRVAAHERASQVQLQVPLTEQTLQEEQLEAVEVGEPLEVAIMEAAAASQDPIHKMLALQMQQVELVRKQLQIKQSADPIQNLLGGDSSSSAGGTNIKGCLAREAYVKPQQTWSRWQA